MTINLNLSDHDYAELARRADAAGVDVSSYLQTELREILATPEEPEFHKLPYDQWIIKFREWIATQRSHNPTFDDSRESIYD